MPVIVDRTYGHGYYGCAQCCGYRYPTFAPNPFTSFVGDWTYDSILAIDCTGTQYDLTFDAYNWASSNTSVATVAGATTNLVGAGTATASAAIDLEWQRVTCPLTSFGPSGSVTAQLPHHLEVVQDTSFTRSCSTSIYSPLERDITYEVVDVNNALISGNVLTKEQFASVSQNSCGNPVVTNTNCSLGLGLSQIQDQFTAGCNNVGDGCGFTFMRQQWLWCPPNGQSAVVIGTVGDGVVQNNFISIGGNVIGFVPGTMIYP